MIHYVCMNNNHNNNNNNTVIMLLCVNFLINIVLIYFGDWLTLSHLDSVVACAKGLLPGAYNSRPCMHGPKASPDRLRFPDLHLTLASSDVTEVWCEGGPSLTSSSSNFFMQETSRTTRLAFTFLSYSTLLQS